MPINCRLRRNRGKAVCRRRIGRRPRRIVSTRFIMDMSGSRKNIDREYKSIINVCKRIDRKKGMDCDFREEMRED